MVNEFVPKVGTLPKKVTVAKLGQLKNASLPIVVTDAGMTNDVKILQLLNAVLPIVRSCELEANVIDVKLLQLSNALVSIVVTDAGMTIDANLAQ